MSDSINKNYDIKDIANMEIKAKEEFIEINYLKRKHIQSLIEEKNMKGKLDNIGTLINNKLVEIGNFFASRNIMFYSQSVLRPVLEKRLDDYYKNACIELSNGIEYDSVMDITPESPLDDRLTKLYDDEIESSYRKYKKYCHDVLNFNVLSNIVEDSIESIFESPSAIEAIKKLQIYEKELTTLGYEKLIPVLEKNLDGELNKRLDSIGHVKRNTEINHNNQNVFNTVNSFKMDNIQKNMEGDCR